jgi:signal transduction histidine kinase
MRLTIRAKTALSAVVVVGLAVLVAAVLLVVLLRGSLMRNLEDRAELRMDDIVPLAEQGEVPEVLGGNEEDGTIAQVIVDDQIVSQSPLVSSNRPLADFRPPFDETVFKTVNDAPIHAGVEFRVAGTRVHMPTGDATIYVAVSLEPVKETLRSLVVLLAVVGPGLVGLVGITTWLLAGRTLAPVEAIRKQVSDISASELTRRVPEPNTGDEIHRLAKTMNEMLARLNASVDAQRMFVSDAAHELRSPLAAIRAELEVARVAHPTAEWSAVLDRVAGSSGRMERLVEDLLALAMAEEQGHQLRHQVDLDEVVLSGLEPLRMSGPLTIDINGLNAARVVGDRHALERVVANLLENASLHAETSITVELYEDGDHAELVIADDGPGVAPEHRDAIFDRFTRLDEARSRRTGGAGLGLAITRRIVEDHGGTIALVDADRGARVVVRLPLDGSSANGE